jgi:indole-3-glycerol phosphate synthase
MPKVDILKEIVAKKKERILAAKSLFGEEELKQKVSGLEATRPFIEAIAKPHQISLIAEIKKSSPSEGIIRQDFNHLEIARLYQDAGVQAISVLTEEDYFGGNIFFLSEVKKLVQVPVLRKDFILEPYQVYESRYFGADAILLIEELLTKDKLQELFQLSENLGMDCLVEVADEKGLKKVLNMDLPLIGINNRSLHTLEVDFKTTEKLYTLIPKDKTIVVESGIKSYQDLLFLKILGVNAVLIGTAFMQAQDISSKVQEIMGW